MKNKVLSVIALLLVTVMALTSCSVLNDLKDLVRGVISPSVELNDSALEAEKLIDFADGANPDVLFESDGWTNGDVFNVVWKQHNVKYENGIMTLGITEEKASAWLNDGEVEFSYTAGEARTQNYYHYGDYEVCMKPSSNPGTASTFFTCTGPYDTKFVLDENGQYVLDDNGQRLTVNNPHDEIDIEFLGNDTTHVQFNFFVNGVGGNEYMYDLGFDASEEFHTYGYRWTETSIIWYVDGKPVYKVTTDKTATAAGNIRIVDAIPQTAGRILANYWCGNERAWGWMGQYVGATNDNGTEYKWISTNAEGAPLNPEEKPSGEATEINWAEIAPIAPEFPSAEKYVVALDGNKANVTYTDVGGSEYKPIEMDISAASAGKNYVHLKVTNNGSELVQVRVNVVDQALVDAGAQNMATNVSATMDGKAVNTDLVWGGSFFDIPAGATAELVVHFNGSVEKLQLMIDSSRNDSTLRSGDITVEDIKFATVGEISDPVIPEPDPGTGDKPADPTSGNLNATINGANVTFQGNVADGYGVNVNDAGAIEVTYTNVKGNSYKNFWATVSSIAATKNTFTMKVTNNGSADVKVRVDLECNDNINANHKVCNLSATQDGASAFTDLEWGGSTFVIAAGATATIEVTYDASKAPQILKIFVDSCQWDDETSHEGSVTLSDLAFGGEYTPEEGPGTEEPAPTPSGTKLSYHTANTYVITPADQATDSVNVTYADINTNTYSNVNAWIKDAASGKANISLKVKNNGSETVYITVKIEAAGAAALMEGKMQIPAGEEHTFNGSFAGEAELLYFFIDSGWSEATTTHAGDITISGVEFSGEQGGSTETPDNPPAGDETGNHSSLTFVTGSYTINPNNAATETLDVSYSGIAGGSYQNICSKVESFANDFSKFTVTIKNNGDATVRVRIDLKGSKTVGNTDICNTEIIGGEWTDLEWGGSFVNVEAGKEVTVTVCYKTNHGEGKDFGSVIELLIYFDTSTYQDANTYSGNLTLSNFSFSN